MGGRARATLSNGDLCPEGSERVGSALHAAVTGRVHLAPAPASDPRYDSFLVTLRDPVARMVSWYYYLHPDYPPEKAPRHRRLCHDMAFFRCWPTLKKFTEAGLAVPGAGRSACGAWARDAARGSRHCWHNYWNYERSYGPLLRTDKEVHAVRTEHLWEDFNRVGVGFVGPAGAERGDGDGAGGHTNGFGRPEGGLSPLGRRNLCRALCREIQVYKKILGLAVNLNRQKKMRPSGSSRGRVPWRPAGATAAKTERAPFRTIP